MISIICASVVAIALFTYIRKSNDFGVKPQVW